VPVQEVEIQREEMRLKSSKLYFLLDRILKEVTEGFCSLTHLSCQFSSRERDGENRWWKITTGHFRFERRV